jgi:iron complex outermembrane receptor protein
MKTNGTKTIFHALLLTLALVCGLAQAAEMVIEEVTVTAERRAESIQDVPLSIAAISGDDIKVGKITDLHDVAFKTPGVTFNQFNVGEPRLYIRGIGNSSDSAASDPAVGVFLDEVYIGRTGGVNFDLFDLERIEILRGPQGTLYGKNTNGGAINIVTAKPSQEREMRFQASVGNYSMAHIQALFNGRLSDSAAGKFVLSYKQRDGFGRNVITEGEIKTLGSLSNSPIIGNSIGAAGSGERLDDAENLSLRGQLLSPPESGPGHTGSRRVLGAGHVGAIQARRPQLCHPNQYRPGKGDLGRHGASRNGPRLGDLCLDNRLARERLHPGR